jgi:hypothetical protein
MLCFLLIETRPLFLYVIVVDIKTFFGFNSKHNSNKSDPNTSSPSLTTNFQL